MKRMAVLVLAAGRSTRMGGANKLLATFDGVPLLRRSVETALGCRTEETIVVLGHQADEAQATVGDLPVTTVRNPHVADGLSSSLRLGFPLAAETAEGVLVMLADQPALRPGHLDALIEAFEPEGAGSIVVATDGGRLRNPVILAAHFAPAVAAITGDRGARDLIAAHPELVRTVEIGPAASLDVDTPELLAAAGGVPQRLAPPRRS